METIGELLNIGAKTLESIDTARLDATLLLGKAISKDKLYIMINKDKEVDYLKKQLYLEYIEKRKNKMPVRYILGECDFFGIDFYVEEGVLIPRSDTEILVEEVLKNINIDDNINICDLCSGTGAIGIAIAYNRKNVKVDEIDYYEIPEKVTKINIKKNNLEDRVNFIRSDLLKSVMGNKKYDIIVSNPPYIKEEDIKTLMSDVKDYEPKTALSGGEDGLIFYRRIIDESIDVLNEGGILAFEIGYDQGQSVKSLMKQKDFTELKVVKDLAGLDRVVIGKVIKNKDEKYIKDSHSDIKFIRDTY